MSSTWGLGERVCVERGGMEEEPEGARRGRPGVGTGAPRTGRQRMKEQWLANVQYTKVTTPR